jgi:hypothetical protein
VALLIGSFGASALLFALAAVPPAWGGRFGFPARLIDFRTGLALAGGIALIESLLVAVLLV